MKLELRENGSIGLETGGSYTYTNQNGETVTIEKAKVSLCRCGASANSPFCDGSHKGAGFVAPAGLIELDIQK